MIIVKSLAPWFYDTMHNLATFDGFFVNIVLQEKNIVVLRRVTVSKVHVQANGTFVFYQYGFIDIHNKTYTSGVFDTLLSITNIYYNEPGVCYIIFEAI